MEDAFFDDDLGKIIIKRNSRAKRLIARRRDGHVFLTVPPHYSVRVIQKLFRELKPRLLRVQPRKALLFDENSPFTTATFTLRIVRHPLQNYYYALREEVLSVSCPEGVDIYAAEEQQKIKEILETALRAEARRFLPAKLDELAKKYDFSYSQIKINKSKTRWGSCSSKGNINLSYFCMLLPLPLIDYVLLHELCHTEEMNHGERFWQLLDKVTDGKAKALAKELRKNTLGW